MTIANREVRMPQVTSINGGYDDSKMVEIMDGLAHMSAALRKKLGERIARWLIETVPEQRPVVFCAFAGTGANELGLLNEPSVDRVFLTDASQAAVDQLRKRIRGCPSISQRAVAEVACFPVRRVEALGGGYDAVTCVGISFYHLPTSAARVATLRQFHNLLRPGGYLFLDNKNWNAALEEERDPVTVYPFPSYREEPQIVTISYEYPRPGRQVIHVQLLRLVADGGQPIGYRTHGRWCLEGCPVHTSTLMDELEAAGFAAPQVFDEDAWPDAVGDRKAAYYQLLIAQKM